MYGEEECSGAIASRDVAGRAKPRAARRGVMRVSVLGAILGFTLGIASAEIPIGAKVPDFRLADAAGNTHALGDYAGKILVLEFWSFKCPPVAAYEDRVKALQAKYVSRGVAFLAVSSNKNEEADAVRLNSETRKLPYPVLMDQDGAVADSVGATHTPCIAILDGKGILRYRGAIDNNKRPEERGRVSFAEEAIEAMLSGKPVPRPETAMSGCTIKRLP